MADLPELKPVLTLETMLRRSQNVLFSEIDSDKVMIDIERGLYFGLNDVAGDIWDRLEKQQTPADLIAGLLESYEIDAETCQRETLAVLERMTRAGLVEIVA